MNENGDRLARHIALCGFASRREADRLVREGHVTVNGHTIDNPAARIDPRKDHVKVDGRAVGTLPPKVYYLFNKPKGVLTTRVDPEGRPCVYDMLPRLPHKVDPVGRLDFDTEGALLLTNDGDMAHRLTHPSYHIPRTYVAKVYRTPTDKTLQRLRKGLHLEDGPTGACRIRVLGATAKENAWLEITVFEGRNRLVRRMMEAVGHPVSKLKRQGYGPVELGNLPPGALRPLEPWEVAELRRVTRETQAQEPPARPRHRAPGRDQVAAERRAHRSPGERRGKA